MAEIGKQDPAKPGNQQYVVKVTFTDDKGKEWQAGSAFTGDEAAVQQALRRAQIIEKRAGDPNAPDAEPKPA